MTSRQKEQYKFGAFGLLGGILLGAFLPDEYNPVNFVKSQFGGLI